MSYAASLRTAHDALIERLTESIAATPGFLAVATVEASDFASVLARFGHARGSELLSGLAERLGGAMRSGDTAVQVGDHTFVAVIGQLKNHGHAVLAGKKLLRLCEPDSPMPAEETAGLRAHVGIALYPTHGADAATLVQRSRLALEVAKNSDRDLVVFDDRRAGSLDAGWQLADELADAIREGELEVHYQPKLDLRSEIVCGAEALVRWSLPGRGYVPPPEFLAVAEDSDLLAPITRYVLNTALRNAAQLLKAGRRMDVSVNLPASMLVDSEMAEMLRTMFSVWDTPADILTLEVTEGAIMSDPEASFATMTRIKELGTRISIDDFGTGYSSFSYFKSIPADELKIDRSFVTGMTRDQADQHIVETITGLAHRFELQVVAEGIEDEATLAALRELDCDIGQGFLIARPMPYPSLNAWLDVRRRPLPSWRAARGPGGRLRGP